MTHPHLISWSSLTPNRILILRASHHDRFADQRFFLAFQLLCRIYETIYALRMFLWVLVRKNVSGETMPLGFTFYLSENHFFRFPCSICENFFVKHAIQLVFQRQPKAFALPGLFLPHRFSYEFHVRFAKSIGKNF